MRLHKCLHKLLATESAAPMGLHKVFIASNTERNESSSGLGFYRLNPKFRRLASQVCLRPNHDAVLRASTPVTRKHIL